MKKIKIEREILNYVLGLSFEKLKNIFIFITVIIGYIICVFFCVGFWVILRREKREFKNNRFVKKIRRERVII